MLRNQQQDNDQTRPNEDPKDYILGQILKIASKQKLLPSFLDQFDAKCTNSKKKRLIGYKMTVQKIYSQKNKFPLIYDPEQAFTQRQKLQQKINKVKNNELDIEYFEKKKQKQGKCQPLYKGFPLESVKYPTKNQFKIFQDFNQKKFLKSYSDIFDDKLQLKEASLLRKQRVKTISIIPEEKSQKQLLSIPRPKFSKFSIMELKQKQKEKDMKKVKKIKLRPITQQAASDRQLGKVPDKIINEKYKPHLEKITIGKMTKEALKQDLYHKMLQIGSFPPSVSQLSISLTKQSLEKYLRQFYERQMRIVDFLEPKNTLNLEEYSNLYTKLKLMPVEHILFMTFMFYDFNNDGYICDNDIRRIKNIVQFKKNSIIKEDLKIIEAIKEKKQFQQKVLALRSQNSKEFTKQENQYDQSYLQLYKLPEITQSTYFQWLKRQKQKKSENIAYRQLQYEERIEMQENQILKKKALNPFNPSVMKFKYNYCNEKEQVRKYILNIKAKKTYISFSEFRKKYINQGEVKKIMYSVDRRATENCTSIKQRSKEHSRIGSSRHHINHSQVKVEPKRKQKKVRYQESISKPFLWYDLMSKLAGVKFEGLKYD